MKANPFKLATVVGPSTLPLLLRRFRLAYIKAGCRQDWRVDEPLRQLSGETPEKSDDVGRILIADGCGSFSALDRPRSNPSCDRIGPWLLTQPGPSADVNWAP
jgi:hypothetical protein